MTSISPPRAPPVRYNAHLGTRWEKEKAAAGKGAFDLPDDPKHVGPWVIGECVGKGASGRVKIARHRTTGQLAAVKILPIAPLVNSRASLNTQRVKSDKQRLGIDREITMMKLMNHPNIMRIYDVYEGEKELFLVLEYIEGGELFDFLVNRGRLPPLEALAYFKQIVYGLNYAHTFSIIHRDLKPENILIHSLNPPLIKIADWGMAAFAPPAFELETSCGSPHYASPEIVNGAKYEGNATDIWSCGVILYALLTGRLPFDDKNVRILLGKVKAGKYEMPPWIDPQAQDLLSKMLVVDVSKRATIPDILAHPWLLNATPGILYIPAPPPERLARPLPSLSHIDPDLLASLLVIWGRHADPNGDVIRRDLLSPIGQGTLAKAFYFLLAKYRERILQDNGNICEDEANAEGEKRMSRYVAPPSRSPSLHPTSQEMRSTRSAPTPPLTTSAISGLAPPLMVKTTRSTPGSSSGSRLRAASPVGPRPHRNLYTHSNASSSQVRPRPASSFIATPVPPGPHREQLFSPKYVAQARSHYHTTIFSPPHSAPLTPLYPPGVRIHLGRDGPRPPFPARGYTHPNPRTYTATSPSRDHSSRQKSTLDPDRFMGVDRASAQLPPRALPAVNAPAFVRMPLSPDNDDAMWWKSPHLNTSPALAVPRAVGQETRSSMIHAPVPVSPSQLSPLLSPMQVSPVLPPRTANAELQKRMDEIAERVNGMVARAGAGDGLGVGAVGQMKERGRVQVLSSPERGEVGGDKENWEEGWSCVDADGEIREAGNGTKEEKGKGGGLGLGRIGREMGNVVNVNGSEVGGKKGKERRRPPTVNYHVDRETRAPSLKPRRSTLSVLGSPISFSSQSSHNHGSNGKDGPNSRLLASPVVGEFRGWFSNLFNFKHPHPHSSYSHNSRDLTLYTLFSHPAAAGREIQLELERIGVREVLEDAGNHGAAVVLRCRAEDGDLGHGMKAARFTVEVLPAEGRTGMIFQPLLSPNPSGVFSATPSPNATPRASALMASPVPGDLRGAQTPRVHEGGYACVVGLVHEKGSAATVRAVWRRLREDGRFWGEEGGGGVMSPVVGGDGERMWVS